MIPVYKKVLFATDLSQNSRYAFYFAASLTTHYKAGIVLLHVMEKLPSTVELNMANFLGEEKWQEMRKDQEAKARHVLIGKRSDQDLISSALDAFCSSATGPNRMHFETYEIIVKTGKVIVDEIINTAKENGCDVIVVGSHKGLLGSGGLGSISRGVLKQALVPVMVVPPPELTQIMKKK